MSGPDDLDPGPPDGGVGPRSDDGLARRDVLKSAGVLPLGTAIDADGLGKHSGAATADEARTVPALPDRFEGWQAGDLHVHTHYSHDVCGDPTTCEDPETVCFSVGQQIRNAETRGLDYLAITDHSTVAAIDDPDFESDEVTLLGAYEHSLAGGHAGFFGVDRVYDRASGTDGQLRALLEELHRDDGVGVINHPRTNISATWTYDGPAGMDAVEVWSIAWYLREELFGGVSSQNHEALSLYDAYLGAGHRLAAVGGSDNHWVHTSWAQGPGQPTTWVHAPGGDAGDIVDGIRHDRTFVSWDWTGPQLLLEAETDNGYDAMTGDVTAAAGPTDVRVTVANGAGHRLRLVLDGTVVAETVAPATPYTWETTVDVPEGPDADERTGHNWLRAEALLEADYSMRALTSPIYFAHRGDPDTGGEFACHPPAQRRQYSDLDL